MVSVLYNDTPYHMLAISNMVHWRDDTEGSQELLLSVNVPNKSRYTLLFKMKGSSVYAKDLAINLSETVHSRDKV